MPDEITRARKRQRELEHARQLAAIRTQSHALVWTGMAEELAATITKWYESGRIVAESLEDALQKASIHFVKQDGTLVIDTKRTRAAPVPPKNAGFAKRSKQQDLNRYLDAAALTDKQYRCASLKWEYGLSVSEIARELRISRATAGQHIDYAKMKMRRGLSKPRPEE